jgi:predicted HAD superfamily Cof-like phosphohydrolase
MINESDLEAFEYYNAEEKAKPVCMTPLAMVKEYHEAARQNTGHKDIVSQVNMIMEEYREFTESWDAFYQAQQPNLAYAQDALKEMSDLVYVIYGLARAVGWNLDEAIRRVHENNLGRMYQPDATIHRREDGKVLKNKGYPAVDLSDLT